MNEQFDLSVPKPEKSANDQKRRFPFMLFFVLVISIVNLVMLSMRFGVLEKDATARDSDLTEDAGKELALKLEKQGLPEQAAAAWKEYLDSSKPDNEQCARIWYRIGALRQDAGHYPQALDAYYRSESHAVIAELSSEIGRRTQECLENLGKFAALRYELAERTAMNAASNAPGDEIVAEIGTQKITRSELDRQIEAEIQTRLSHLATYLPEDKLTKQQETLLKQYSTTSERMRFLNQFILEEILYRKARDSRLADEPDVRDILRRYERGLLAQKVIEKELKSEIKITRGDLQTYYDAHKKDYVRPARAGISHILVADEDTARDALDRLNAGEDFGKLALELSMDGATRDKAGEIEGWAEKGGLIPGIGYSDDAQALIFGATPDTVATNWVKTSKGCHLIKVRAKQPESEQQFAEAEDDVFRALRSLKEREVQETLLARLRDEYDAVIHQSAFMDQEPKREEK